MRRQVGSDNHHDTHADISLRGHFKGALLVQSPRDEVFEVQQMFGIFTWWIVVV